MRHESLPKRFSYYLTENDMNNDHGHRFDFRLAHAVTIGIAFASLALLATGHGNGIFDIGVTSVIEIGRMGFKRIIKNVPPLDASTLVPPSGNTTSGPQSRSSIAGWLDDRRRGTGGV